MYNQEFWYPDPVSSIGQYPPSSIGGSGIDGKRTITTQLQWSGGHEMEDNCGQRNGRGIKLAPKHLNPLKQRNGSPFIGPVKLPISSREVSSTSDAKKYVGPPLLGLAPGPDDAAKYIPLSLSNIPIQVKVHMGTMDFTLNGTMAIRLRETCGEPDLNPIIEFWRGLSSNDPVVGNFPSTEMDAVVVLSCVQRSLSSELSFVADAFSELKIGNRRVAMCGCLLATELTCEEFEVSIKQPSSFFFASEWMKVQKLFRPNIKFFERLFQRFGKALFINALIVDNNATHSVNCAVTWSIYRELFAYAINCAQLKGFHLALYIAKDKYEVIIFRSFGFKTIQSFLLDNVNEISLMIWSPFLP